jgi:hypothetical protein|tara:strand:+ start:180 stop:407 length:228 start_codon:yes stop_codon:yes gene_type:complete
MSDPVNHPKHYTQGSLEYLDAVDGLQLGFYQGNIMKYVVRYKYKHAAQELRIQDLEKALFYLKRLIEIESTKKVE